MSKIKKLIPFVSFSILSLGAQGLVFIFNILVANKLTVPEYSSYSLIISIVNLFLLISCQWHTSMMQYCGSAEYADKGNVQKTNQIRNILFFVCYILISFTCIILKDSIEKYIGGKFLIITLVLVLSKGLQEVFSSYLIAIGKRQLSAINLFVIQVASIILLFVLNIDIGTILFIQIITSFLTVFMLPCVNKVDFKPCTVESNIWQKCIRFAAWQLMGSIALYIISYGDNYIIKLFLDYNDIAVYNAAYKIFNAIYLASHTIATYYISPLAKAVSSRESKAIKNIFWNERIIIFVLCTILHLFLILIAPQLFSILYQGKYNGSVTIFRVLVIASIIRYWTVFEMVYFNSIGKIRVQQVLNVISAGLKVVFGFVFIHIFGLVGVAYSTLLSTLVVGIASFMLSERNIWELSKIQE